MSAIAGLIYFDGRVDREGVAARMAQALAHCGPDGMAGISAGPASFAHFQFHTTEESVGEKLPVHDGDLLLTAATRLDDRTERLHALGLENSALDSRLLLDGFRKWGEKLPERLLGDFALAIYDKTKQELFCARDHFGIKPFYYYHAPGRFFIFASQIRALFCHPETPRLLNKRTLAEYWAGNIPGHVATSYEGIQRLPQGHWLRVNKSGVCVRPYWQLDAESELKLGSDAEYEEAFREVFKKAVSRRLSSRWKVGFQLSGGIDSTAVACVGRDFLRDQNIATETYSTLFPHSPESDETDLIKTTLQQPGFNPHFLDGADSSPFAEFPVFSQMDDELFFGANAYLVFPVHRAMARDGARICLDGFDGDTTIGYGRYRFAELAAQRDWQTFRRELKAHSKLGNNARAIAAYFGGPAFTQLLRNGRISEFLRLSREAAPHMQSGISKILFDTALMPALPRPIRKAGRYLMGLPQEPVEMLLKLVRPEAAQAVELRSVISEYVAYGEKRHTDERRFHAQTASSGLLTMVLERVSYADAHFKTEGRHPFRDRDLVQFCVSLPSSQKLKDGVTRSIMRRSLAYTLPEHITYRTAKANMAPALQKMLRGRDRATMARLAETTPDFLDKTAVRELFARYAEQGLPHSEEIILFRVLTSSAWLMQHGFAV